MDYSNNPRVKIDDDGTMYVDGVEVRVKEIVTEDKKSMNIAYRDLKNSFDVGAIGAEEFYTELEVLRDFYLEDGSAAWWKYTRQILAYEQSLFKEQEELQQKNIDRKIDRLSSMYAMGAVSAKQYYDELMTIRDTYFDKESSEWESFTASLAEFYATRLGTVKKQAESLTERLSGGIMHHYTIKDRFGYITDRFYQLMTPDLNQAKKYFEGYEYLQKNGAPSYIMDEYLSMYPGKALDYLDALDNLGTELPEYFSNLASIRGEIQTMSEQAFGADVLSAAISEVVKQLTDSGFFDGVEINQNFYGDNISPSEVAQQTVNALRLQGVDM